MLTKLFNVEFLTSERRTEDNRSSSDNVQLYFMDGINRSILEGTKIWGDLLHIGRIENCQR